MTERFFLGRRADADAREKRNDEKRVATVSKTRVAAPEKKKKPSSCFHKKRAFFFARCRRAVAARRAFASRAAMGLTASSLALTQYDVEEVQEHCDGRFTHREIQSLYKRFRSLDKRHKGYLSEDELMSIPELAISPLASRVVQVFQNLNFKDFCRMLSAFSDRASREEKLDFMFRVYDVDRDGLISLSDLETIVKHLVGSSLNEEQVAELITRAMEELSEVRRKNKGKTSGESGGGITFAEYRLMLEGATKLPTVRVPVGFD